MYYQIEGSNMRLAGSLHAFPPDSPSIPQWLCDAYDWCEQLVFEHDIFHLVQASHFSDGTKLESLVSPSIWQFLNTIWPIEGPFSPLNTIRPWAAMLFAVGFVVPTVVGVEIQMLNWAARDKKPAFWLESAADFSTLMESIPSTSIERVILQTQNDVDLHQRNLASLYSAWASRDLNAVYSLVKDRGMIADEKSRGAILTARNHAWLKILRGGIRPEKKTLVVIGALHLCGENNIAELIEKDGNRISLIDI